MACQHPARLRPHAQRPRKRGKRPHCFPGEATSVRLTPEVEPLDVHPVRHASKYCQGIQCRRSRAQLETRSPCLQEPARRAALTRTQPTWCEQSREGHSLHQRSRLYRMPLRSLPTRSGRSSQGGRVARLCVPCATGWSPWHGVVTTLAGQYNSQGCTVPWRAQRGLCGVEQYRASPKMCVTFCSSPAERAP